MDQQHELTEQAVTPAAVDGSPTPPPAPSDNAASAGIKAPSAELAREAFDRLARGERPESINRDLYQQRSKDKPTAEKAQPLSPPPQPDPQPEQQQSDAQPQPGQWPEGMDAKDRNVLKRAQMDPETWAAIPPSNQKKILSNLRASQAAADRAFQQRRQQELAAGKDAGDPAPAHSTQTDPEALDEPTLEASEEEQTATAAQQAPATPAPAQPMEDVSAFLNPQELATLEAIGGKELAETYRAGIGRVVQHFTQQSAQLREQNGQLVNVAAFLMEQHAAQQFDAGLNELTKLPGLENLREESRTAEREALRKKADLLHRAAGDPKGYPYAEAVRDAAASLFKTNVHQTSQARLLTSRSQSLNGSPDRGDGRQNVPRELSARERNAAIYANLTKGMSPEEARRAVDG